MTIYEEQGEQFRPSPSMIAMASTGIAAVLIGAAVATLTVALTATLLSRYGGWTEEWLVFAPLLDQQLTGLFSSPPLENIYRLAGLIIPGVCLLAAFSLIQFWPFQHTLASHLVLQGCALGLIAYGVVTPAFEPLALRGIETAYGLAPLATTGLLGACGIWCAMLIERRAIEVTANIWWMDTVPRRLRRWLPRIPIPFLVLAAFAWWNDNEPLAYAQLIVMGATLLENISRTPRSTFEEIRRPHMREAAFTTPLLAATCIAGVVWAFGVSHHEKLPPRVANLSSPRRLTLEPLSTMRALIDQRMAVKRAQERRRIEAERLRTEAEKPKIDIRWSHPRKKGR